MAAARKGAGGDLPIRGRVVIPDHELEWSAVRSSGPGGQHVNTTATKVDLRFDLEGSSCLSDAAKKRLRQKAQGRLDADGQVVVTSQATRSQDRNLEDARNKLAELVRSALDRPKPRRPTRPSKAQKRRRLDAKRQQKQKKQARGKVRSDDH